MKKNKKESQSIEKVSFYDIDEPLRIHFMIQLSLVAGIVAAGIILAITFRYIFYFWALLLLGCMWGVYVMYHILQCLEGNVLYFEGECIEIVKEKRRRPYILIFMDNGYYVRIYLSDPEKKNITEGCIVAVYTQKNTPHMIAEDVCSISTYYHIYLKRKSADPSENKEKEEVEY